MEYRQGSSISLSLLILSLLVIVLATIGSAKASKADVVVDSYIPFEFKAMSDVEARDFKTAMMTLPRTDHVVTYYQNPDTRSQTLAFFEMITGDYGIATAILKESISQGVQPTLAFALAYQESDFNPRAFNRNADSVDRGVFQLNSKSFPKLSVEDFYDIHTNIRLGVAHLAFCLQQGGNDVAALAVYNAGLTRVSKGGTPKMTLDYIYKITGNRDRLDALFEAQVVARHTETITLAAAVSYAQSFD